MDPLKLTCSQQLWLHSSVGRALHRYRRGHGFESRWSLNLFFRLLFRNCLNCVSTAKIFHDVITHYVALDFISHIWKFITFRKVKRRNSKIKLKSNAGLKYNPNKMISDRRCVKERERDFLRWNSPSKLRRVKPQEIGFVPGQNTN